MSDTAPACQLQIDEQGIAWLTLDKPGSSANTLSGAVLRETGATNRTSIDDYRDAINDRTRLLLRVHPSNFRITGFTARPELRELVALGREAGLAVYEDLGSGCVADLRPFGIDEPLVSNVREWRIDAGIYRYIHAHFGERAVIPECF